MGTRPPTSIDKQPPEAPPAWLRPFEPLFRNPHLETIAGRFWTSPLGRIQVAIRGETFHDGARRPGAGSHQPSTQRIEPRHRSGRSRIDGLEPSTLHAKLGTSCPRSRLRRNSSECAQLRWNRTPSAHPVSLRAHRGPQKRGRTVGSNSSVPCRIFHGRQYGAEAGRGMGADHTRGTSKPSAVSRRPLILPPAPAISDCAATGSTNGASCETCFARPPRNRTSCPSDSVLCVCAASVVFGISTKPSPRRPSDSATQPTTTPTPRRLHSCRRFRYRLSRFKQRTTRSSPSKSSTFRPSPTNADLRLVATEFGGHVAFLARGKPRFWAIEQAVRFFESFL